MSRLLIFLLGMLAGLLLLAGAAVFSLPHLAGWLVVDSEPGQVDAIVVLGGGDGSRLRKAVELSGAAQYRPLLLVDNRKSHWNHIARNLCDEGFFDGQPVECLVGSVSTLTDAQIALDYCRKQGINKLLVVTDPYHSRRAQLIFWKTFKGSDIETTVIHSGYYGKMRLPAQDWWKDEHTLQAVWVELGKIVAFGLAPLLEWWQDAGS